jgi:DNA-binding transcriptional LysR family regulator
VDAYAGRVPGDIQIRQLEYVAALAREQHFGRAAAACHVSQSALSDALRRLETELGVAIVERGHRFGGFTAEGSRVVEWARRILATRDALRSDLSRMQGGLTATLRIGAIPTAAPVTTLLAAAFQARNPLARVQVETASAREIGRRLAEFDLDAGLVYLDGDEMAGKPRCELYRERYVLVTPLAGPLGGRSRVGWAEVAEVPLCTLTPEMHNRRILDGAVRRSGALLQPVLEADTVDALWAHLRSVRWSSVLAHSWLHSLRLPPGMCAIPLPDLDPAPVIGVALVDAAGAVDVEAELDRAAAGALALARPRLRQVD